MAGRVVDWVAARSVVEEKVKDNNLLANSLLRVAANSVKTVSFPMKRVEAVASDSLQAIAHLHHLVDQDARHWQLLYVLAAIDISFLNGA